jgi:hypothetical protein
MDGHRTHCAVETVEFCISNNIKMLLMPAHTSHILQPLDVSVFGAYKAAYRRSVHDTSLWVVEKIEGQTGATKNRCIMIAKALIAYSTSVTTAKIRRGFKKTGIFPPSFDTFLHEAKIVTNVPPEVTQRSDATVAATKVAFHQAILGRRRIDFRDEALIVDCDA